MKFISVIECFLLISGTVAAPTKSGMSQLVSRDIKSARQEAGKLSKREPGNCVGKCATGQSSKASSASSGGRPGGNTPAGGSTHQSPPPSSSNSQHSGRGRSPTPRAGSNRGSDQRGGSSTGGSNASSRSTQYMTPASSLQASISRHGSGSSTSSRASSNPSRDQRSRSPSAGSNASSRSRSRVSPSGSSHGPPSRQGSDVSSSSRASSEIRRRIGPQIPSSRSASPGSSEASSHGLPRSQKPTVQATLHGPGWMRATKGRDQGKSSFHTVAKGQQKSKTWSHPHSVNVILSGLHAGKDKSPSWHEGTASGRSAGATVMKNSGIVSKRVGYGKVSSWSPDIGMKEMTTNEPVTRNGHVTATATKSEVTPAGATISYQGPGLTMLSASNDKPREKGYSEFGPRAKKFSLIPGDPESREIKGV